MKRKLLSGALLGVAAVALISLSETNTEKVYQSRDVLSEQQGIKGAFDFYKAIKKDVRTGEINPAAYTEALNALKKRQAFTKAGGAAGLIWEEVGPDNIGGRTRAVQVDVNDVNHVWAGSVAGGLFESFNGGSEWERVDGFNDNLVIGSMVQLSNGNLYVGTGSAFESAGGSGGSAFVGNGLYVSKDGGATFAHVEVAEQFDRQQSGTSFEDVKKADDRILRPTSSPFSNPNVLWSTVTELAANPAKDGELWIAFNGGIALYNEANSRLTNIRAINGSSGEEIVTSEDGQTILAVSSSRPYRSQDGGETWELINGSGQVVAPSGARIEMAISQDDKNFMYACVATQFGSMHNVYGSSDGGDNWLVVLPGGVPAYDPFGSNGQGNYDNIISVVPGSPGEAILGGVTLWKVGLQAQPEQIAANFAPEQSGIYVHSDIHELIWDKNDVLYIGTDGGIHKSFDLGGTFGSYNRGYNVTQYYDIAHSPEGFVMGGAQDNGTTFMNGKGITKKSAASISGGDGFDCAISQMNGNILFSSVQQGVMQRSNDAGNSFETFYDADLCALINCSSPSGPNQGFYTTFNLYENSFDENSKDSAEFTNESLDTLQIGDQVTVNSKTLGKTFTATLPVVLLPGESVLFQDKYTSIFAGGFNSNVGVFITRGALQFGTIPQWIKVADGYGQAVHEIQFGPDGTLWFSTFGGRLYRIKNVTDVWDNETGNIDSVNTRVTEVDIISIPGGAGLVTDMAVDPNDPNHMVVTYGNYGVSNHVYETFNALDATPSFDNLQGNLPAMPVYDANIDLANSDLIVIGTEFGVFSTTKEMVGGQINWTYESENLGNVAVFDIEQQTWPYEEGGIDEGVYYAGTHARGAWKALQHRVSVMDLEKPAEKIRTIEAYPNPTVNNVIVKLNGNAKTDLAVAVYNTNGSLVQTSEISKGTKSVSLDVSGLNSGNYIVTVKGGDTADQIKFVKL